MKQVGRVVEVRDGTAYVLVRRASACGENCAHCKGGCAPTNLRANAANTAGAAVGDMVTIETADGAVLRSAALVYVMPLVVMLACYLIADALAHITAVSIIVSIIGLAGSFFILRAVDKRMAPKPEITAVIGRETEQTGK